MKLQFIFVLFLLVSCSTKKQNTTNSTSEAEVIEKDSLVTMADTSDVELKEGVEKSVTQDNEILEISPEASKINSLINNNFKNTKKLIFKNEFGGGDCWGAYQQYSIQSETNTATTYKIECGEYGFTNYWLIESERNKSIFLKATEYENDMDETTPDFIKEWIIDFQDTSKIYHRKYERVTYETVNVPDSIGFQEYKGEPLNIKEALSTIKSSKTAKKEDY